MDTQDTRQYQAYESKIQAALTQLIERQPSQKITVSNICKEAETNRTTFYSHYKDICDLLMGTESAMRRNLTENSYKQSTELQHSPCNHSLLRLLYHIKENRRFYQVCYQYCDTLFNEEDFQQLGIVMAESRRCQALHPGTDAAAYYLAFHKAGFNIVIQQWAENECQESPEYIADVLQNFV